MKTVMQYFILRLFLILSFSTLLFGIAFPVPLDKGADLSELSVRDLEGNEVSLRSYRGKTVILTFVAFWCDTYKDVIDGYGHLQEDLQGVPVEYALLFIDQRQRTDGLPIIEKLLKGKKPISLFADETERLKREFRIDSVPTTVVLDTDGRVVYCATKGYPCHSVIKNLVRNLQRPETSQPVKQVHLTFDDFPSGPQDAALLDLLKKYNVRVTFFVIGENARLRPALIRRAAAEGHRLQNHSNSHGDFRGYTFPEIVEEIRECSRIVESFTGIRPTYFRPPGGYVSAETKKAAEKQGLKVCLWDVNSFDYQRPGSEVLIHRIFSQIRDGDVILFHAGVSDTLEVLPEILQEFKRRGIRLECK